MQKNLIIALSTLGLVASWACFGQATQELGFLGAWVDAFTSSLFGLGLHIDLLATDLILFTIAVFDRQRIGDRALLAVVLTGTILGVCVGLPVYWWSVQRARAAGDLAPAA